MGITRSGRLVIRNVQEMDAGEYRCVAKNEAGSDSAKVNLEVGCKYDIIGATLSPVADHPPPPLNSQCVSNHLPIATMVWYLASTRFWESSLRPDAS